MNKKENVPSKDLLEAVELSRSGAYEEALRICRKIKSQNVNNAVYHNVVGILCRRLGLLDEALMNSRRAVKLDEGLVAAKMNIANIELQKNNIETAINLFERIVSEEPAYQEAKANLALAYKSLGEIERSLNVYKKLNFVGSWSQKARFNYSTALLTIGNFKEGWRHYEYRWKVTPYNNVIWPIQDKPIWKGERGTRVALWREQGIGDEIICLSLVSEVKEMCSSLSVYVDPRLQALCKRAMPEINFVKDIEELQNVDCDYHLPLGSVPGLIRNDISEFNRTVKGYLKADPEHVEAKRTELNLEGKTAIGISWKSFNSLNKTKKSVQLRDMERMFSGLDVVLVNLQYGDVEDEIREFKDATGIDVVQCASVDNREDLDGLAALIEVCDLVVSIPNVTVHLAGALAKDTWVLLPYVANFWWLVERTDSIWYPSVTLYRQPTLDDWDSVYASVRKDLQNRLAIT
jgi:tetratricopeptide (TPR) repeat protein